MKVDTPLFRQYQEAKDKHPGKILFFRMGDFFELFHDDAKRVAALLGLTLTSRKTNSGKVPMAGVPVASFEQHVSRLVRIGESVVICDQVGNPKGKALMERRITQVITPGTMTDQSLLPEKDRCIAMAINIQGESCGYAWLDLARGELFAGSCAKASLGEHLSRLCPAEILVPEDAPVPKGVSVAVHHLSPWDFEPSSAADKMCERFSVKDLRGFGLADDPLAVGCANALMQYAEDTQCQPLDHICRIGAEKDASLLSIDATARKGLEITVPAKEGGPTLRGVIDGCRTTMGSRLLARRLASPLRDKDTLEYRLDAARDVTDARKDVVAWLDGCCDLERIAIRIQLGNVKPRELSGLRDTLERVPELTGMLEGLPDGIRKRYSHVLEDYSDVARMLREALAEDPPHVLKEGGVIAKGYDEGLDGLRQIRHGSGEALRQAEEKERQKTGMQALRSGHNRVHGFYLELPRSKAGEAPGHFLRLQTTKHTERYVTEELIELERKSQTAQGEALELESLLYRKLVDSVAGHAKRLRHLADAVADIDVAVSMSDLMANLNWVRPEFAQGPVINIKQGRHPIVESAVDHYVPNDTALGTGHSMEIVTGPNMGGKSTYMRQIALIAFLAHIGAPVPAQGATIGDIDSIMTRIGSSDDLPGGRSTFMVEMSETASILNTATERTLVILDEIGRGTSTFDGLSLAWATAQTLLEKNRPLVLLATHYLEMAMIAEMFPMARNIHMTVGEHKGEVVMLHRVREGASSRSFGIQVAKMAGVPADTLALAKRRLAELEKNDAPGTASQPVLFNESATPANPALKLLRNSDPDELSPRQAQELLFELKSLDDGE